MRALAILLVLGSLGAGSAAQDVAAGEEAPIREITFRQAIELGLAYNLGIKTARLGALMEQLAVRAEEAAWDPTFTAGATMGEVLRRTRTQLGGADVLDTDNFNFNMGLTQPFAFGPSLGLSWRTDRTFSNSTFATINPAYDSVLELKLTVPLLQGWGRDANMADLRASQASAQGARYQLVDEASRVLEDIAAAYWDLVYLQGQVRVLQKSVDVAREIEESERRKLRPEIGRSTRLDVVKAVAETKRRETVVIQGLLDAANASDELRRLVLPFTGGAGDRIRLRAAQAPEDDAAIPPLQVMIDEALSHRPDLLKTDTDLTRLEQNVIKARDSLRVRLDLTAGASWSESADDLGESIKGVVTGELPSFEGGLNLEWPIGRRSARAALRRAELDLERARVARNDQVNDIIVEVRKSHRALRAAIREIEAAGEAVKAADAALEGERKRLERGSTTILDVARLEENLTTAELQLLRAQTDREAARIAIFRATGTLLERVGIDVESELEALQPTGR